MIGVPISEVFDEQTFILGYHRRRRHRDFGVRAIFSEHVELKSVGDTASAGFHFDHVAIAFDHVTELVVRIRAEQSFDEFGSDSVSIFDRSDHSRPVVQFWHQHDAGACLEQLDQPGPD
ncbi:hypothetical protein M2232_004199 [Bradyrhizobium japonicum]|nr:hypothetical protein [Bradyrhizobium japonicum]MCW2345281.1 hypothetical protein [Bradyrhizobium japonicum]BAL08425.1 hypothetical exported glutamine-rich protein [Bradyrhizobium japonicum USDA 6]GEC47084.1 hypothetical protein BJA01nite_47260 [Bradyrhizobium japonicum]